CLNVVTREAGVPHAVLLRAAEPVQGIRASTWGPGLLARAMQVDTRFTGTDLCGSRLWIARPAQWSTDRNHLRSTTRIGIDYAGVWARRRWRIFDAASPYVSTARRTPGFRKRNIARSV
ncbi:MAG: DNA-3-methyladenine glycosylase, partial [Steroidobacteraceae bacterium]